MSGDSGIEASGETERSLRASTSSSDECDRLSRTPDSLRSDEGGARTDSALGDTDDTPTGRSADLSRGVRFRGTRVQERRSKSPPPVENRVPDLERNEFEESGVDGEPESDPSAVPSSPVWNFPPVLEEFDLMESDADPTQLEEIFADDRYMYSYSSQ